MNVENFYINDCFWKQQLRISITEIDNRINKKLTLLKHKKNNVSNKYLIKLKF